MRKAGKDERLIKQGTSQLVQRLASLRLAISKIDP